MPGRQLGLFGTKICSAPRLLEHGGDVRKGRRKIARPVSTKRPLHVVFRSSRAKREWSMLRPAFAGRIRHLARMLARRCDVAIYRYANVGNHLHILVRARSRPGLQSFLRAFAGVTARIVTGARRGRPVGKFWSRLVYSRVVSWGRELRSVSAYVVQNAAEALGLRPHAPRKRKRPSICGPPDRPPQPATRPKS